MGKIKEFFAKSKKKIAMLFTASLTFVLGAVGCFAAEGDGLSASIASITGALYRFSVRLILCLLLLPVWVLLFLLFLLGLLFVGFTRRLKAL